MKVLQENRKKNILMGEDNNALVWLIIINAVIFSALIFIRVIYQMSYDKEFTAMQFYQTQITDWFVFPGSLSKLATRPWTILTFMFTHQGVMLLISNILWLWCFGYILQDLSGNTKLFPLYLYGGFAGAVFFMIAVNALPAAAGQMMFTGADASVMAVAIAATTLSPTYKIFPLISGGIPLWVLTIIFVAIDYASIGRGSAPVAIAHLAAGCTGFMFVKELRRGNDLSKWMHDLVNWFDNLFNPEKKKIETQGQHIFYKATRKPFEKKPHFTQQKLDEILDKINENGYDFLSDEEKEFLKKASREDF